MKKALTFTAVFLLSAMAFGQNVQYRVLSNEPPVSPRFSLNADLFQLDVPLFRIDSYSVNAGLWGYFEPVHEKIGVQFLARKSYLALGRLGYKKFPGNLELEAGGYLVLRNYVKNKQTKVTLKKEYSGTTYSTNVSGDRVGTRTEIETYILVPSDKKKYLMARGGAYFKRFGMSTTHISDKDESFAGPDYIAYNSAGIYAGINLRTITSLFIETDEYGVQFNSIGQDLYADVLILPVNTFTDTETGESASDVIKNATKSFPVGFRAGYKLFQVDKRAKTGKTFGMSATAEVGYKPYAGFTLAAGIGMTFVK